MANFSNKQEHVWGQGGIFNHGKTPGYSMNFPIPQMLS